MNENTPVQPTLNEPAASQPPAAQPTVSQPTVSQQPTQEWTPEAGLQPVAPATAPTVQESFSLFDDDEGSALYSGTVLLDGQKVRVRELTAAEMAVYSRSERDIARLMQDLALLKDENEAERAAEEIKARQRVVWDQVIGWAVSGWELKRPNGTPVECTPENKAKLRASKKAELCDKIVQRSSMGRDLTAFLAES